MLFRIVKCAECGGSRLDTSGEHSPHWAQVDGAKVLINCSGRQLWPKSSESLSPPKKEGLLLLEQPAAVDRVQVVMFPKRRG